MSLHHNRKCQIAPSWTDTEPSRLHASLASDGQRDAGRKRNDSARAQFVMFLMTSMKRSIRTQADRWSGAAVILLGPLLTTSCIAVQDGQRERIGEVLLKETGATRYRAAGGGSSVRIVGGRTNHRI